MDDLAHRQLSDGGGGENIDRDRRSHGADHIGDGNDHTEVDDVDAQRLCHRPEHRNEQDRRGNALKESAKDQQDDSHHQTVHRGGQMHTDNEINKLRGNAGVGEKPRKRGRGRDDEERHR